MTVSRDQDIISAAWSRMEVEAEGVVRVRTFDKGSVDRLIDSIAFGDQVALHIMKSINGWFELVKDSDPQQECMMCDSALPPVAVVVVLTPDVDRPSMSLVCGVCPSCARPLTESGTLPHAITKTLNESGYFLNARMVSHMPAAGHA